MNDIGPMIEHRHSTFEARSATLKRDGALMISERSQTVAPIGSLSFVEWCWPAFRSFLLGVWLKEFSRSGSGYL
jgi:hypothetical protein